MPSTIPPLVRFANFEVDLRAGELRREGSKVRLQEQPFALLTVLLESAGEVVTREELRKRLWSEDTFVDFDHRLAVAVNKLRDALRDSAEKPMFIETVGRRGYRFVGHLESTDCKGAPDETPLPSSRSFAKGELPKVRLLGRHDREPEGSSFFPPLDWPCSLSLVDRSTEVFSHSIWERAAFDPAQSRDPPATQLWWRFEQRLSRVLL